MHLISGNGTLCLIPSIIKFVFLGTASANICPDNASKYHVCTLRCYRVKLKRIIVRHYKFEFIMY